MRTEPATRAKSANCFVLTSPLGSHKMPLLGRQSPLSRTRRGTSNLGSLGEQILMKAATRLRVHRCFLSAHFLVVVPPVFTLSPTTPSRKVGNPAAFGQGHRAWPGCMPRRRDPGSYLRLRQCGLPCSSQSHGHPERSFSYRRGLGNDHPRQRRRWHKLVQRRLRQRLSRQRLSQERLPGGTTPLGFQLGGFQRRGRYERCLSARYHTAAPGPMPHSVILERSEQSLARRPHQRHRREPRPPMPRFES